MVSAVCISPGRAFPDRGITCAGEQDRRRLQQGPASEALWGSTHVREKVAVRLLLKREVWGMQVPLHCRGKAVI